MNFQNILESIGLSPSESAVYVASLSLGPASAIKLGQKAGLTRQMIYTLIPGLVEKGLIKHIQVNGKRLFQATEPEVLNDRVAEIAHQVKEAVTLLKTKQATSGALPILSVYENPISMREWYRQVMAEADTGEELLIWATNTTWYQVDPDFLTQFLVFKRRKGIKDKIIAPDTPQSRLASKKFGFKHSEYRFAPEAWQAPAEKWIWRDQVCYLTISENATNLIVLQSAQLAALERFTFEQIWKNLRVEYYYGGK